MFFIILNKKHHNSREIFFCCLRSNFNHLIFKNAGESWTNSPGASACNNWVYLSNICFYQDTDIPGQTRLREKGKRGQLPPAQSPEGITIPFPWTDPAPVDDPAL